MDGLSVQNIGMCVSRQKLLWDTNRKDVQIVWSAVDPNKIPVDEPWCDIVEEFPDIGCGMFTGVVVR